MLVLIRLPGQWHEELAMELEFRFAPGAKVCGIVIQMIQGHLVFLQLQSLSDDSGAPNGSSGWRGIACGEIPLTAQAIGKIPKKETLDRVSRGAIRTGKPRFRIPLP
jgi:hypothetical protein